MFKKSDNSPQYKLFTSGESIFSGKSLTFYEDESGWHNQFCQQVTMKIDEDLFSPLYDADHGAPNASIRVLVSMMVLKEAEGLSDQKLFENCRFNMLTRCALGLLNIDDPIPTESTYYLFRKKVYAYAKAGKGNLFEAVFAGITQDQCIEFDVSGKRVRTDSKLLGSNITWLSRYELVHETLRLFYKEVKKTGQLDIGLNEKLDELLKVEGNKVVYRSTYKEIKRKLQELGGLIYSVLSIFITSESVHYETLKRVFTEQFKVDEVEIVVTRDKEEISAKSVQSPHDTDCHYRDKDGDKVKGYSVNITESCDDDRDLNLIGNVDVREASTSDVDFLQDDIAQAQEVFPDKIEDVHADGAYNSPENQAFCVDNNINLHLHAIQGTEGRYELNFSENGELSILDTTTSELIEARRITTKKGEYKWRIKTEKGYRYFDQKQVNVSMLRQKIAATPIETLQKRNNVEATIFQLGYHYPNAKSRYRGLIKHQMWANMRCLWVNFVRILKFRKKLSKTMLFWVKLATKFIFRRQYWSNETFLTKKTREYFPYS